MLYKIKNRREGDLTMPAPHPAGLRMLSATLADRAQPRSLMDEVVGYRFAPIVPPIKRPWGQLVALAMVYGVSLVGFCVLVLIVAEASNG